MYEFKLPLHITNIIIAKAKKKCLKGDAEGCNVLANFYIYGCDSSGFSIEINNTKAYKYESMAADIYAKACHEGLDTDKCSRMVELYLLE